MKISNKTKYGIQFMLSLAIEYGDSYINIKDIAQKENISIKFLENIVSIIKPSELIHVKRGAMGGYRLSKAPTEITLREIVELLEGEILEKDITVSNENNLTGVGYVTNRFLNEFRESVIGFFTNTTLSDLIKQYNQKQNNFMFYI